MGVIFWLTLLRSMPVSLQHCPGSRELSCRAPVRGEHNGTFSITSVGGVVSTFLLEWFKKLQRVHLEHQTCLRTGGSQQCSCEPLADGGPPRHLISCHFDDDGVFKHLADPRALNRFSNHRAVYVVGSPIDAIASVFRRRFQCWHYYRLQNCWFTRAQREGLIPCEQPAIKVRRVSFTE